MKKKSLLLATALALILGFNLAACGGEIRNQRVWDNVVEKTAAEFAIDKTNANYKIEISIIDEGSISSTYVNGNKERHSILTDGNLVSDIYYVIESENVYGYSSSFVNFARQWVSVITVGQTTPYVFWQSNRFNPLDKLILDEELKGKLDWFRYQDGTYVLKADKYNDFGKVVFGIDDLGTTSIKGVHLKINDGRLTEFMFWYEYEEIIHWDNDIGGGSYSQTIESNETFFIEYGTVDEIEMPQTVIS